MIVRFNCCCCFFFCFSSQPKGKYDIFHYRINGVTYESLERRLEQDRRRYRKREREIENPQMGNGRCNSKTASDSCNIFIHSQFDLFIYYIFVYTFSLYLFYLCVKTLILLFGDVISFNFWVRVCGAVQKTYEDTLK